jgi:hypothetical protein
LIKVLVERREAKKMRSTSLAEAVPVLFERGESLLLGADLAGTLQGKGVELQPVGERGFVLDPRLVKLSTLNVAVQSLALVEGVSSSTLQLFCHRCSKWRDGLARWENL